MEKALHKIEKKTRKIIRKKPAICWNKSWLMQIQIHRKQPDSTKRNEKCIKFESVYWSVWFSDTKTDWAIRHSIRSNKNSILGVDYALWFGACYITGQYTILVFFCCSSSKNCVFIIFTSFFDEVLNFLNITYYFRKFDTSSKKRNKNNKNTIFW